MFEQLKMFWRRATRCKYKGHPFGGYPCKCKKALVDYETIGRYVGRNWVNLLCLRCDGWFAAPLDDLPREVREDVLQDG